MRNVGWFIEASICKQKMTYMVPIKIGAPQKERLVFQPSIFGCYLGFREGTCLFTFHSTCFIQQKHLKAPKSSQAIPLILKEILQQLAKRGKICYVSSVFCFSNHAPGEHLPPFHLFRINKHLTKRSQNRQQKKTKTPPTTPAISLGWFFRRCKDGTTIHPSRVLSNLPWSQEVERCQWTTEKGVGWDGRFGDSGRLGWRMDVK